MKTGASRSTPPEDARDSIEPETRTATAAEAASSSWTYLSNHAHVMVCLARDPEIRVRDIARLVGITERGISRIVAELEDAGVVKKRRVGRRNRYTINRGASLRHPLENHATIDELLRLLSPEGKTKRGEQN